MAYFLLILLPFLGAQAAADTMGFDSCGPVYDYKIGEYEKTEFRLRICEMCCHSGRADTIAEVVWLDPKTKKPKAQALEGGIGALMFSHRVHFEKGLLAYQNEGIHQLFSWDLARGRFVRKKVKFEKRSRGEQKRRDQLWEKFVKATDDDDWAAFDRLRKENTGYYEENLGELAGLAARGAYRTGGILDKLVDEKISLEIYDFQLRTPLFNLVEFIRPIAPEHVKGALRLADKMLAQGARLDIVDGSFESPLDKVIRDHGDDELGVKLIEELKKRGAKPSALLIRDGARPKTPLHSFNPRFAKFVGDELAKK